jgi:hypothetical protein
MFRYKKPEPAKPTRTSNHGSPKPIQAQDPTEQPYYDGHHHHGHDEDVDANDQDQDGGGEEWV